MDYNSDELFSENKCTPGAVGPIKMKFHTKISQFMYSEMMNQKLDPLIDF